MPMYESKIKAVQVQETDQEYEKLYSMYRSKPYIREITMDIIRLLKEKGCSFGMAKEVLVATEIHLDMTMFAKLITPQKISDIDDKMTSDIKE